MVTAAMRSFALWAMVAKGCFIPVVRLQIHGEAAKLRHVDSIVHEGIQRNQQSSP